MPTAFVSYSHKDRRFVRRLVRDLQGFGIQVWLDEKHLSAGDSLLHGIRAGIDKSDYFIVVLSAASVVSEWVQRELDVASSIELNTGTKKVIPLLRDSVALPAMLEGKVYADFRGRGRYQLGLAALRRALGVEPQNRFVLVGVLVDYFGGKAIVHYLTKKGYVRSRNMPTTEVDVEIVSGYLAYLRGDEQSIGGEFSVFQPQKSLLLDRSMPVLIRDHVVIAFGFALANFRRIRPEPGYTIIVPDEKHALYVLGRADDVRQALDELCDFDKLPSGAHYDLKGALKWWVKPVYISGGRVNVVGRR